MIDMQTKKADSYCTQLSCVCRVAVQRGARKPTMLKWSWSARGAALPTARYVLNLSSVPSVIFA